MERKGFGIRLGAFLIDIAILIVIQIVLSLIFLGTISVNFGAGAGNQAVVDEAVLAKARMFAIVSGLISLAYWSLEIVKAQSVGKMALKLTIGTETGLVPAPMNTLVTRYLVKNSPGIVGLLGVLTNVGALSMLSGLLGLVFLIGCFLVLGQKRQALQDMIAKTAVYGAGTVPVQGFQPVMPGQVPPPPAV